MKNRAYKNYIFDFYGTLFGLPKSCMMGAISKKVSVMGKK